jgi:hypothetical protein
MTSLEQMPNPFEMTASEQETLFAEYRQTRSVGMQLNNKLVERLGIDVLEEGARKLGLLKQGTFVFETEDESSVLMDYCIYNVFRNGRNAGAQYLLDSPPPENSMEMRCLKAMQRAFYSLFVVEKSLAGLGVQMRDLRSDESVFVVDQGFGISAQPKLVLATRLLVFPHFLMTGGAALPLGMLPAKERDAVRKLVEQVAPPEGQSVFDPAVLIRAGLARGASSRVRYQDPGGSIQQATKGAPIVPDMRPSRNSKCPCGSGKKYKQCCMKKRS